jgi:hypothetical protein
MQLVPQCQLLPVLTGVNQSGSAVQAVSWARSTGPARHLVVDLPGTTAGGEAVVKVQE